jgi:type I restriction enzyme S subunit
MREDWQTVKLGEVCKFQGGSQPPKSKFIDAPKEGYIRLLQIRDFKSDKRAVYIPEAKKNRTCIETDIMIGRYGASVGQIHRGKAGAYNVALIRTSPNENVIYKNYFYYFLISSWFQNPLMNVAQRSAQAGFSKDDIHDFQIPLPPLPEQERIVSILDKAFEGIDKAIAQTEQNLASARELFESYLNNIFTQKGEDWVEKKLGDICQLVDSLHKTPKYIEFGGFPMVRVTDIKDGTINLSKARRVSPEVYEEFSKKHKPMLGDIVLSRVGTYGVPAVVETTETFCLGQNTIFLLPTINPYLIFFFMLSRNCREQVDKMVSGTTQPTISMRSIREMRFPLPPKKKWKRIIEHINALREQTQLLEALYTEKLNDLKELKQSLLQQAFAGELTKEDAA